MRKPATVSACLIVRDEADNLDACLTGVAPHVSEVVIVDTGSTDGSQEIAHRHGARVIPHTWTDDFSAARNRGLAEARGDWILVVDADERLPPAEAHKIPSLTASPTVAGWFLLLKHLTRHGAEWQPRLRLFRNHPWARFRSPVHEDVLPAFEEQGAELRQSDLILEHLGYVQGQARLSAKWNRNLRILERHLAAEPGDTLAAYHLGRQLVLLGRPDEGQNVLSRLLDTPCPPSLRASALNDLAAVAWQYLGDGPATLDWARHSLDLVPDQTFARVAMAMGHLLAGARGDALNWLRQAVDRVRDGRLTPQLANEVQVPLDRLVAAMADLLPDGPERTAYRNEARQLRLARLPKTGRGWLADWATGGGGPVPPALLAGDGEELEDLARAAPSVLPPDPADAALDELATCLDRQAHTWVDIEALGTIALALLRRRRIVRARKALRQLGSLLAENGRWAGFREWGGRLAAAGFGDLHATLLQAGHDARPEHPGLALELGRRLQASGTPAERALGPLRAAARLQPDCAEAQARLALAAWGAGQVDLAEAAQAALARLPDATPWLARLAGLTGGGEPGRG